MAPKSRVYSCLPGSGLCTIEQTLELNGYEIYKYDLKMADDITSKITGYLIGNTIIGKWKLTFIQ